MKVFSVENGIPTASESVDATVVVDLNSAGNNQATATEIPRSSQITMTRVTLVNTGEGVRLPNGANVGDIVEIYSNPPVLLYPPIGETFLDGSSGFGVRSLRAVKISSSVWYWI